MATARLATTPTPRATTGAGEVERVTRAWSDAGGCPKWLFAIKDDPTDSAELVGGYLADGKWHGNHYAEQPYKQFKAALATFGINTDEWRQTVRRDVPLRIEWETVQLDTMRSVKVVTSVKPIADNFPQWGIDDPDKFHKLMTEFNTGALAYYETLGFDERRWPAYDECVKRMTARTTQPEEKIIPFAKHKDVPDAKDNPDWSVALGKVDNMGQTTKRSELDEALDRKPDGSPADDAPVTAPAWGDDNKKRGRFFQYYKDLCAAHAVPLDRREPIRKRVLKEKYHVDSLKGFNKPEADLLKALKAEIEIEYPLEMAGTQKPAANAPEPPPTRAPDAGAMVTPVATVNATSAPPKPENGQAPAPTNIPRFPQMTTLTGVNVGEISKRLNAHLPPEAYTAIKYGQMSGKTDVDGDRIRDRFEEVFGPMGIGWRITPHPTAGRVEYRNEERTNKDGEIKTWHIVTLVAHTLSYSVVMPDGSIVWTEVSTTTDQHDNVDEQYAYRGALTSLMKQFYKLMGGMNHVMYNEYTHIQAQRDLRRTG